MPATTRPRPLERRRHPARGPGYRRERESGVRCSRDLRRHLGRGCITGGSASSDANGIAAAHQLDAGTYRGREYAYRYFRWADWLSRDFHRDRHGRRRHGSGHHNPAVGCGEWCRARHPAGRWHCGTASAIRCRRRESRSAPAIATGGGTLGGTSTIATNASGVATFTDLSWFGTTGSRTLSFSATGLTGATSASFNLTVGACDETLRSSPSLRPLPSTAARLPRSPRCDWWMPVATPSAKPESR